MLKTFEAIIDKGRIITSEPIEYGKKIKALITILDNESRIDEGFLLLSEKSFGFWDNEEDSVYDKL